MLHCVDSRRQAWQIFSENHLIRELVELSGFLHRVAFSHWFVIPTSTKSYCIPFALHVRTNNYVLNNTHKNTHTQKCCSHSGRHRKVILSLATDSTPLLFSFNQAINVWMLWQINFVLYWGNQLCCATGRFLSFEIQRFVCFEIR